MDFFTAIASPFSSFAAIDLAVLRTVVGAIFVVHGLGKSKVWKAAPAPGQMQGIMKLLSVVEPLGGCALILGFLTPVAASGLAIIMVGATWLKMTKWHAPFTSMTATGWEFDLLILAACCVLTSSGAGALSLDRILGVL